MNFDHNFENEFDDDFEDEEVEAFIQYLFELKDADERAGMIRIPNPIRLAEMEKSVRRLIKITREEHIEVEIEYGIEPFAYAGFITLKCPYGFSTSNIQELCMALQGASNIEFVIENNIMQIGVMYYHIFEQKRLS